MTQKRLLIPSLLVALLCLGGSLSESSFAQKASVPKYSDKVAIATDKIKELLALIDTDRNGKISKQDFMKFMSAAFDRLDPQNTGEVDSKELLRQEAERHARPASLGK